MDINATYVTFILYLIFMVAVGLYFYRKANHIEDYLLGGRGMGSWVTALSAQASDMSGWLLMGLPGAIFLLGMDQVWIGVGLALGTFINWLIVAPRLRVYTERTNSLTLSTFFGRRFRDPTNTLRLMSAVITLIFFTIYAAAGLVSAGKLFESMFHINYKVAVIAGAAVMIFYTLMGGFLAVCWTDLFQGLLMFFAIVILPIVAYNNLEPGAVVAACTAKNISLDVFPEGTLWISLLALLSSMAWGLGYFGQPHILVRFMSIKSIRLLPRTMTIAMVWVIISLIGAVIIGLLAIPMYNNLPAGDNEKVFIFMIRDLFNPYLGGVLLAAILAAIMSTIDSQLLVSSSTLTEDFYANVIRKNSSEREQMIVSRFSVLLIAIIACSLAMDKTSSIFKLVTFAWGGFGAAFGPVVLMALFSSKTSWRSALCGMIAGTIALLVWHFMGMNAWMYEIVPGFIVNIAVIIGLNHVFPNDDPEITAEFESVEKEVKHHVFSD
ncbi:MAG: sodium/proline symporter PutP [Lentisphaerae bacterium]|nr:sodium/proline symporter PutP [Lentisphaerota bacterium]MCP4103220.1 sodium/proline symporter PutP [Lentisphaerota bacterium]